MSEGNLTLGQYFKLEREKRGIELKQIEERTKISFQTLTFLENDRFDLLPPRAFLRGFLQVIAKEFAMDGEELIRMMDEALVEIDKTKNLTQLRRRGNAGRALRIILAVAIAIILGVLVLLSQKSCDSKRPATGQNGTPAIAMVHDAAPQEDTCT